MAMKPNVPAYVTSLSLHDNVPTDITAGTHFYASCHSNQLCLTAKRKFLLV
jgi:hypothetical protein